MDGMFDPNPVNRFKREFGDDGNWSSLFKGETWNIRPFGIGNPKGGDDKRPAAALGAPVAPVTTADEAGASQRRRVLNLQASADSNRNKGLLG